MTPSSDKKRKRDGDDLEEKHLNWTALQGHCLTGGGRAEELYTDDRGFPFSDAELPHFHLFKGDSHAAFQEWTLTKPPAKLVTGAWDRLLFCGGWHHSTNQDERVYNLQSHNLFIDLRIPRSRDHVLPSTAKSLEDLSPEELRFYARQHVFAGYSVASEEKGRPLCARHHCIDWSFVGHGRPRPNKWWIDMKEDGTQWKESSYATDERGQYYYFERWERRPKGSQDKVRLALRKSVTESRDGIVVVIDDHFSYILARQLSGLEKYYGQTSLVAVVDAAIAAGDLETARAHLSIQAGHGTISSGWKLDCAIEPWQEGNEIPFDRKSVVVSGETPSSAQVLWGGSSWDVLDCSFETKDDLLVFLSEKES